jgi:hypothetical protein
MKSIAPTQERLLILLRVVIIKEHMKHLARQPIEAITDEMIASKLTDHSFVFARVTHSEIQSVLNVLAAVYHLVNTKSATPENVSTIASGLQIEREVEVLQACSAFLFAGRLVVKTNRKDVDMIVRDSREYVAIGMTADELVYLVVTAVNNRAAAFAAHFESGFD